MDDISREPSASKSVEVFESERLTERIVCISDDVVPGTITDPDARVPAFANRTAFCLSDASFGEKYDHVCKFDICSIFNIPGAMSTLVARGLRAA